jgi:hypothetical protein
MIKSLVAGLVRLSSLLLRLCSFGGMGTLCLVLSLSSNSEFRKYVQQSEAIQMVLYKTMQVNVYLIGCLGLRKFMFEMCVCMK